MSVSLYVIGNELFQLLMRLSFAKKGMNKNTCTVLDYVMTYKFCCCLVPKLCLTLCDPMDCSPSDSSVHGISQARIWEWVAMPSSRRSSPPRIEPVSLTSPELAAGFFTTSNSCTYLVTYYLCFCTTTAELSSLNRSTMSHKA